MILEIALPVPVPKTFDYLYENGGVPGSDLIGCRARVPFGPRVLTGVIVGVKDTSASSPERLKSILSIADADPIFDDHMLALGQWLSRQYLCSLGEALDSLLPPAPTKKSDAGENIEYDHDAYSHGAFRESGFSLTDEQNAAVQKIHEALHDDMGEKIFLLRGVSAAGKTEVYLSAIKDVLAQGKTALYLAPEIGLVMQLAGTLQHRFGEKNVCVWHSGRSLKDRREDWWRVKRGDYSVVVGARSASLLPIPNLGVIIVDEEQDSAWKEDRKPRFHVRDLVRERARLANAAAIFGSATPSLEILYDAKQGQVELIEMNERAVQASAPLVRLVDMKTQKSRGVLSPDLEKAMSGRLAKKEQVILFINRRGFHRLLKCPACEWSAKCPDCGVAQVVHKGPGHPAAGVLICHYCAKTAPLPSKCPSCGHKKLSAGGTGTERVTEEVKEKFPWAKVARWDRDSVKKTGEQEKILEDFQAGDIDVLVGTQLVAQGFHFPKVTLVGVVNADSSLHAPDFRAAERTFQLLMQVAGRAGRDLVAGEVIIQTRHPDHAALQCAAALDYRRFSEEELKFRADLFYPPYTRLIKIETTAKDAAKAQKDMDNFVAWVMALVVEEPIGLLGPAPTNRKRKGIGSFHVLLKVPLVSTKFFSNELRAYLQAKIARFKIDVDPV